MFSDFLVFLILAVTVYSSFASDIALELIDDFDQESVVSSNEMENESFQWIGSYNESSDGSGNESTPPPLTITSPTQSSAAATTTSTTTTTADKTEKPTTQITTTTTTLTQPPGPLKCSTCNVDEIGPYAHRAGSGGCIRTRTRLQIELFVVCSVLYEIIYII